MRQTDGSRIAHDRLDVELQPYGSKNLDGYHRAVALPVHMTEDSVDQNVSLTSTECILHSMHFPVLSMIFINFKKNMTLTLLFYLPVNGLILPLTACKSSMFKLVNDSVYD
jgi:hypothetical protein